MALLLTIFWIAGSAKPDADDFFFPPLRAGFVRIQTLRGAKACAE